MMSLKRVVLIAALVVLAMPAVTFADGVTFAFGGGSHHMYAVQPNATGGPLGTIATNDPAALSPQTPPLSNAIFYYVSRFSGNVIPTSPLSTPTPGFVAGGPPLPPQVAPTFGSLSTPPSSQPSFGSVQWTTGVATAFSVGANSSSTTYSGSGSNITIFGNGALPGTGAVLFNGSFTGPTTFASIGAPKNPSCTTCNFWYSLTGPVGGTLDPGLMALLNMPGGNPQSGQGFFFSFIVGFVGPNDTNGQIEGGTLSVVVPEPGTLALFGTGLVGLAGFIRRRMKA